MVDSLDENTLFLDIFMFLGMISQYGVYMNNHCSAEGVKARIFTEQLGVSNSNVRTRCPYFINFVNLGFSVSLRKYLSIALCLKFSFCQRGWVNWARFFQVRLFLLIFFVIFSYDSVNSKPSPTPCVF